MSDTTKKIDYKCLDCGSNNAQLDATVTWDVQAQKMRLMLNPNGSLVSDNSLDHCVDCGENGSITEVTV